MLLSKIIFNSITQFRVNDSTVSNASKLIYEIIVFILFIANFSEYNNWEF